MRKTKEKNSLTCHLFFIQTPFFKNYKNTTETEI